MRGLESERDSMGNTFRDGKLYPESNSIMFLLLHSSLHQIPKGVVGAGAGKFASSNWIR